MYCFEVTSKGRIVTTKLYRVFEETTKMAEKRRQNEHEVRQTVLPKDVKLNKY